VISIVSLSLAGLLLIASVVLFARSRSRGTSDLIVGLTIAGAFFAFTIGMLATSDGRGATGADAKAALRQLVKAENVYFARHGHYTSRLADLAVRLPQHLDKLDVTTIGADAQTVQIAVLAKGSLSHPFTPGLGGRVILSDGQPPNPPLGF